MSCFYAFGELRFLCIQLSILACKICPKKSSIGSKNVTFLEFTVGSFLVNEEGLGMGVFLNNNMCLNLLDMVLDIASDITDASAVV